MPLRRSPKRPSHGEQHRVDRIGWLRAAVLGANDGIVSTASLLVGVAAAQTATDNIVLTGVAGLVAGAMSMAAGEYVSVHAQADTESADLQRERAELKANPQAEHQELAAIYIARGVAPDTAHAVADQLMQHDALGAHAHDELGITSAASARPLQAALTSAASFALGAALPLLVVLLAPAHATLSWLVPTTLGFLALTGVAAAKIGGVNPWHSAGRVTLWGALALAVTAGVGSLFGVAV